MKTGGERRMRSGGGRGRSQIGKRKREEGKMSAEMSCLCAAQGEVSCGLRTLVNLSLLSSDLWHRHNGTEHVCVCTRVCVRACDGGKSDWDSGHWPGKS